MSWNSRSLESIEQVLNNLGYLLLDTYFPKKFGKSRKVIIQDRFGYKYDVLLGHLVDTNRGISFVEKRNPYSLENISIWLKLNNSELELCKDNIYIGAFSKLKIYHFKCNDYFYRSWANIQSNDGCSICSGQQIGKYNNVEYLRPDLVDQWIKSEHNKTPKEVTLGSNENVYWQCPKCEHKWWTKVNKRTAGENCPKCANEQKESLVATECKQYFFDNYNAVPEYTLFKNPKTGYPLRCDIYIPDNVYIEIHGPQHYIYKNYFYKNEEEFKYRQHIDRIKKEYCQENGLYIEVDLRKIKTSEEAIKYIENLLEQELSQYVY